MPKTSVFSGFGGTWGKVLFFDAQMLQKFTIHPSSGAYFDRNLNTWQKSEG
jgi:hypothetical protein